VTDIPVDTFTAVELFALGYKDAQYEIWSEQNKLQRDMLERLTGARFCNEGIYRWLCSMTEL
jgi:hypothetical protein